MSLTTNQGDGQLLELSNYRVHQPINPSASPGDRIDLNSPPPKEQKRIGQSRFVIGDISRNLDGVYRQDGTISSQYGADRNTTGPRSISNGKTGVSIMETTVSYKQNVQISPQKVKCFTEGTHLSFNSFPVQQKIEGQSIYPLSSVLSFGKLSNNQANQNKTLKDETPIKLLQETQQQIVSDHQIIERPSIDVKLSTSLQLNKPKSQEVQLSRPAKEDNQHDGHHIQYGSKLSQQFDSQSASLQIQSQLQTRVEPPVYRQFIPTINSPPINQSPTFMYGQPPIVTQPSPNPSNLHPVYQMIVNGMDLAGNRANGSIEERVVNMFVPEIRTEQELAREYPLTFTLALAQNRQQSIQQAPLLFINGLKQECGREGEVYYRVPANSYQTVNTWVGTRNPFSEVRTEPILIPLTWHDRNVICDFWQRNPPHYLRYKLAQSLKARLRYI